MKLLAWFFNLGRELILGKHYKGTRVGSLGSHQNNVILPITKRETSQNKGYVFNGYLRNPYGVQGTFGSPQDSESYDSHYVVS